MTPTPTPFAPSPGARTISGLFDEPRPALAAQQLPLPTPPASSLPAQGPYELVLYDTRTGARTELGTGEMPSFSPDGKRLA
ncbi:MAG: hypothetical protein FJ035_05815 [Chloroflexi bacterium]|nr:hypothetical protein [Chloroflexota bacterium]